MADRKNASKSRVDRSITKRSQNIHTIGDQTAKGPIGNQYCF